MSAGDLLKLILPLSLSGIAVAVIIYAALEPDKVGIWGSRLWRLLGHVWHRADRKAVAYRVQGEVNSGRQALMKHGPGEILEGKMKLRWRDVNQARAMAERGDVIVFMRRSDHHAENVTHALMAYLPKALIPRARRYVDQATMKAADLTVAKALLSRDEAARGALDVFYEEHLDPAAAEDQQLHEKLQHMDEIDLHGWLVRVLLVEYRLLGQRLHPGPCSAHCVAEGDKLMRWLGNIASLGKGEHAQSLVFPGQYFRVGVIFVAQRDTLASKGLRPYRARAKKYLYTGRLDAVYLIARDPNVWAVEQLVADLETDALVAHSECHKFKLRPDFAERRGLHREHAIVACLRRKKRPEETEPEPGETGEFSELPEEVFDPSTPVPATIGTEPLDDPPGSSAA